MELLEQYNDGIIALTGCLASRFVRRINENDAGRRPRARRPADPGLRPRGRLLRGPGKQDRRSEPREPADRADRQGVRSPARRHRRRPLPRPRGLRLARRAALRPDQEHARRAEDDLRHQRVLPQEQRGDDQPSSPHWHGAIESTIEIADRVNVRLRTRQATDPEVTRRPTGESDGEYLREIVRGRPGQALRRPGPGGRPRARSRWSSR